MLRRLLTIVCIGVLIWLAGCREDSVGPGADQTEAGFVKLFNGKDLSGWETSGNARWFVEDGNLEGTQGANNAPGDLFTTETY